MPVPDLDLHRIRRFAESRVPMQVRNEVRVEVTVRGNSVTVVERRPPWNDPLSPDWTTFPITQLRWDPKRKTWSLWWRDRNARWHTYSQTQPTPDVTLLLAEIDTDPTCIFWG
ncbi:MAG: DUF3024 domain-containing protein [Candidatus Nanopelagicales bacterium]|nr:DUF3024 domain-containing protein [Candidatus Nanopelagicales bacterium]MDZ4248881.1 DUF3024 domain-containing protein [Candidatus Nanopelagicales bacterium]MDZ7578857.1 DUF3024 domain-containing protein [Candidatus Nanopelagicales bacterium]